MGSNAYQINQTKYQLSFADEVIGLGKQGFTRSMIATHFGVAVDMLDTWSAKKPAFKDGMAIAMTASQAFHEAKLIQAYENKDANASLVTNLLRANFGDTYKSSTDGAKTIKTSNPEKINFAAEVEALIESLKGA
jgi:hypothetical protein